MKAARLLIVDDEPLARERIRTLLPPRAGIVVGEAGSVAEAIRLIHEHEPDVVFLDVEMPDGTGFDVLQSISAPRTPIIIFVTAYDAYAVRAFSAAAIDYVLKPVEPARLTEAVDRAIGHLALRSAPHRRETIRSLVRAFDEARKAERIVLHTEGRSYFIEAHDIIWIEAKRNNCVIHRAGDTLVVRNTLTALHAELPATLFVRAHRSAIVNLSHVRYAEPFFRGEYVLVLSDGTKVATSRNFGRDVHRLLEAGS
jgi:two-component system, LytTR family, response regulator